MQVPPWVLVYIYEISQRADCNFESKNIFLGKVVYDMGKKLKSRLQVKKKFNQNTKNMQANEKHSIFALTITFENRIDLAQVRLNHYGKGIIPTCHTQ